MNCMLAQRHQSPGGRFAGRRRIVYPLAIATIATLTILGSTALVATPARAAMTPLPTPTSPPPEIAPPADSTLGNDYSAFDYAKYRFEGIPQPW